MLEITFDTIPAAPLALHSKDLTGSAVGLVRKFENYLTGLEQKRAKLTQRRDRAITERQHARDQHGQPFPDQEALESARARVHAINDQLDAEHGTLHDPSDNPAAHTTAQPAADTTASAALSDAFAMAGAAIVSPPDHFSDRSTPTETETVASRQKPHAAPPAPPGREATRAPSTRPPPPAQDSSTRPSDPTPAQQQASSAVHAEPTVPGIQRNQDGYIVTGTSRDDRDLHKMLRHAGFKYSRRGFWYLPRRMLISTQNRRVAQLQTDLRNAGREFTAPSTLTPDSPSANIEEPTARPARQGPGLEF